MYTKANSAIILLLLFLSCGQEAPVHQTATQVNAPESNTLSTSFTLNEGDFLFQDSDCGPFCDAIEKVTNGIDGANLSHVGMVIQGGNSQFVVLEAITKGVVETPIDTFLNRSVDKSNNPKVLVGRLKPTHQVLIQPAVQQALQHRGKAYDAIFDINNDQYYCSELLYLAFKIANGGTPIFQLRPMTYKDPDTKKTFPVWSEYFQNLEKPIPEGQPGLNPGSMSRSIYLDIVHAYGKPDGWRGKVVMK